MSINFNKLSQLKSVLCAEDYECVVDFASKLHWVQLPKNTYLFHQGEEGNSFYIVVSGLLQVVLESKLGSKPLQQISSGEYIGEFAMFTDQPRSAGIVALRESYLIKFPKEIFTDVITQHPKVSKKIICEIINRVQKKNQATHKKCQIFAIIPLENSMDISSFVEKLQQNLKKFGKCSHIDEQKACDLMEIKRQKGRIPDSIVLSKSLEKQETKNNFLLYEANPQYDFWTKKCIEHCDQVILIAPAKSHTKLRDIEKKLQRENKAVHALILMYENNEKPNKTIDWLNKRSVKIHHHCRWNNQKHFEKLARFFSGNTIGLVLGGGGVRGLAHLGVIKALNEAQIPIDIIGGTSAGGLCAISHGIGMDPDQILEHNRAGFLEQKIFQEYDIPFISLIRGRKYTKAVQVMFRNLHLEDLWTQTFTVSCNLTTGKEHIHREGVCWKAGLASGAVPGILPPIVEKNEILVDGGIINNLPSNILKEIFQSNVILVSVSKEDYWNLHFSQKPPSLWQIISNFFRKKKRTYPNILDLLMRSALVNSINQEREAVENADVFLQPPVTEYGMLEFEKMHEVVKVSYQYTQQQISDIRKQLAHCRI
ncbi:cyclic nucleotide-binding and patatin-like phospholipase domain-containing protein [Candidatus Uabimicrobium sp. HlEnr_7]|uniref:cyclic nucleotide-binding and patatin-like phospholipase domain-containing protein n=1 Tax=Candidatus Uabimicrobium helgolandensis TaxID=3095367 RepID=UPI0035590C7F